MIDQHPKCYSDSANHWVIDKMKGHHLRVLDIGCWQGALGLGLLQRQMAIEVVGIELDDGAIEIAQQRITRVFKRNLEKGLTLPRMYHKKFDYVILGDVLEHLRNGQLVLSQLKKYLTPLGKIIFSIPNVRNIVVVTDLIRGHFTYGLKGILDHTHVRFFTARSIENYFSQAGFEIVTIEPKCCPPRQIAAFYPQGAIDEAVLSHCEKAYTVYDKGGDCRPYLKPILGDWQFSNMDIQGLFAKQFVGVVSYR